MRERVGLGIRCIRLNMSEVAKKKVESRGNRAEEDKDSLVGGDVHR